MTPPAASGRSSGTVRSAGPSPGGQGIFEALVNSVLLVLRLKSSRGTLPKSFASLSQVRRSSADWKTIDSIQDAGSGAGATITRSFPSNWSGKRRFRKASSSITITSPDIRESPNSTMTGTRCPASRMDDSIASLGTLPGNSGIQPGKHSRGSR